MSRHPVLKRARPSRHSREIRRSIIAVTLWRTSIWALLLSAAAQGQEPPLRTESYSVGGAPRVLVVRFNQPVAPTTWSPRQVPKGVRLEPAVAGRYDWPDSVTLRFTPALSFPTGNYSLILDSTFTGRYGAHIERPTTLRFFVDFPRVDVALAPHGSLHEPLELRFNGPAGTPGQASNRPPSGITLTPYTGGRWLWLDSLRLRFTPAEPFVPDVRYTIVIDTSFRGSHGIRLYARRVYPFPQPIRVERHWLPDASTAPLILLFTAPIDPGANPESLLTIEPRVEGAIDTFDSLRLQFTPRTGFTPGVRYAARLSNQLRGVNGGQLASEWRAEFTIWLQLAARPRDLVRPNDPLEFRFSRRVQPLSGIGRDLPTGFRLAPHVSGHVEWPDSQTIRFVPDSALAPGGKYVVTLGRDFVAPDGARLADSITVTMTVIRPGIELGSYRSFTSLVGPVTIGVSPGVYVPRDTIIPLRGFHIHPAVPGSLWWTHDGQVEFRPDSVLQPNTGYLLLFDTTFRAPNGLPLLKPFSAQVYTHAPGLVATWPVATFVTSATRFRFVMTQPIMTQAWADSLRMAPKGYYPPGHPCRRFGEVRFRSQGARPLRHGDLLFGDLVKDSVLLVRAPPTLITVVPDRELPAGCVGTLTAGRRTEWSFQTAGAFRLRSARAIPGEPVPAELDYGVGAELTFTTPVSERELLRHVRISPSVAARFVAEQAATVWQLQAALEPATTYRLSADSALRDGLGQPLGEPFTFTFTTAPAKPALVFQSTHRTVATRSVPTLDVTTINVGELQVCTARVPDSARVRLVGGGWWAWNGIDSVSSASTECRRLTVRRSPRDSVRSTMQAPWRPAWRSRAGLYAVRVSSPQVQRPPEVPAMVVFHVTDLAVHARIDRDRGIVLVARRADGKPVEGAAVTARGCNHDVMATAATDRTGLAQLAGMAAAEERAPYACFEASWRILEVSTPDDYDAMNVPLREDGQALVGALPASVVIPDRLVYRQRDSIRARAVVRRPSPDSVRWVIVGEEREGLHRRAVLDTLVPVSRTGTAALTLTIGPRLPPGIYQTALLVPRLGRWRQLADAVFWVTGDPVPDAYLSLTPDRRWGARGDSVGVAVEAWHRDGTPVAGVVELRWAGTRLNPYEVIPVPLRFTPVEFSAPQGDGSPSTTAGRGTLILGADGRGRFTIRLPDRAAAWPWRTVVEARMKAVDGSVATGRAAVDVYPAEFNLAIRIRGDDRDPVLRGVDSVEVLALRPDGTPVSRVRIDGLLAGRKWSLAPQEGDSLPGPSGPMVPDTLDRCSAATTDRPALCVLRRFPAGYATMVFDATDSHGRSIEVATTPQYGRRGRWNEESEVDTIALTPSRSTFVAGETAAIKIEHGRPGGLVWLTVASGDHMESRVVRLSGVVDTIRLPLRAEHVPRATVTATAWYPESGNGPVTYKAETSQIDLEVRNPAEDLAVDMELPERAEAASTRTIVIKADAGHDSRDPAEILVWAIDQRLAAADSQRVPDVTGALMRPPLARRVTASSLRDPAPVAYVPVDPGSVSSPGTYDEDPDVLRYGPWGERGLRQLDDLPGPILLGAGHARPDGTATLNVRLPEMAGTYRIIAVALTSAHIGSAERLLTVDLRK